MMLPKCSPYDVLPRGFGVSTTYPRAAITAASWKKVSPYAACGPPWMLRISGYRLPAVKSAGLYTHASIGVPSKLRYTMRSGAGTRSPDHNASLTWVSCTRVCDAASREYRSPICAASPIVTANRWPSGVALYAMTSCAPVVSESACPDGMSNRIRFDRPCDVMADTTVRPSADHTSGLPPPPRGGCWSPVSALPTSASPPRVNASAVPCRYRNNPAWVYDCRCAGLIHPENA